MSNPSKRLFVGSLPYRFTEGELLELFAQYGRIIKLKIMHTPWGKSRGLGFVEFDSLESAIEAKTKLHNYALEDRSIIVDYAEEDPALTREGQERHRQAAERRPEKFKHFEKDYKKPHSSRQSVYDSRHHHSNVGKKFSSRNKKRQ